MKLGFKQLCLGAGLGIAALALSACGGGSSGVGSGVVVISHGGYWGYYSGIDFCDFVNNYCGSGLAYGITGNGFYYNGVSSGTTSPGIISTGVISTGITGGTTSTGTTGGSTSTGTTGGGSTSSGITGGVAGVENSTTDTSLMQAMVNMADVNSEASAMVNQFPMSFEAARQLVQLSDKMQILQQKSQLTSDDRAAIATAALAVGQVSQAEVANALAKFANGDKSALTNVELKYAHNVGLSDDEMPIVRDQILPQLGVQVPQ